jgi:hypothetical protein
VRNFPDSLLHLKALAGLKRLHTLTISDGGALPHLKGFATLTALAHLSLSSICAHH